MTQLTKNFQLWEFDCKDGTKVPKEYIPNVHRLADNLQVFRDHINDTREEGTPEWTVYVSSGYRTVSHNSKQKGASSNSKHLKGLASDIKVYYGPKEDRTYMPPSKVALTIETLIATGKMEQGGVGRYKTFTHYDPRGYRARWGKN